MINRANYYLVFAFGISMEATQCPYCEGEIELDSGVSGKIECPHCGREFEWNIKDDDSTIGDSGPGKFVPPYAWLFSKAGMEAIPVPLILALVLLPISLLAGLVMILLSANFFIAGFGMSSWVLEELAKFDFSNGIEMFWGIIFGIVVLPITLLVFLIAVLVGIIGLAIIYSAIVSLIRR